MRRAVYAFVRAVGWGALAGASPYLLILAIILTATALGEGDVGMMAVILLYPLAVSAALVLGSALVFGLPLTAVLSRSAREDGGTYALAGIGLGAVVPVGVILAMGGALDPGLLFVALPGAFAGGVTGASWGRWREAQRR